MYFFCANLTIIASQSGSAEFRHVSFFLFHAGPWNSVSPRLSLFIKADVLTDSPNSRADRANCADLSGGRLTCDAGFSLVGNLSVTPKDGG